MVMLSAFKANFAESRLAIVLFLAKVKDTKRGLLDVVETGVVPKQELNNTAIVNGKNKWDNLKCMTIC